MEKLIGADHKQNFRYERKLFISELSKHEVQNMVLLHPAIFTEIFHKRYINNIYFDSPGYRFVFDNVDGVVDRVKFRIRWYGNLLGYIKKPILEIKIKKEFLGNKIMIPLKPFELNEHTDISSIFNPIDDRHVSLINELRYLTPTLLNRYARRYFQSSDRKFRITIDTEQWFYAIFKTHNYFLNYHCDDVSVIMELKYEKEFDNDAKNIISNFPLRITKSSKYVRGINKLHQLGL